MKYRQRKTQKVELLRRLMSSEMFISFLFIMDTIRLTMEESYSVAILMIPLVVVSLWFSFVSYLEYKEEKKDSKC